MAVNPCKFCEGREPAAFLMTELSSGETAYVGLACLPPFVSAIWEDAGLPALTFDVDVPDQTADNPAESEAVTAAAAAPRKGAGKGRRTKRPPTEQGARAKRWQKSHPRPPMNSAEVAAWQAGADAAKMGLTAAVAVQLFCDYPRATLDERERQAMARLGPDQWVEWVTRGHSEFTAEG